MFEFDLSVFATAAVGGVPLLFVVLGLVEWLKTWVKSPELIRIASMITGVIFGGGYMIADVGVPSDFPGWFALLFYGVALGLVTSGIYDAAGSIAQKIKQ